MSHGSSTTNTNVHNFDFNVLDDINVDAVLDDLNDEKDDEKYLQTDINQNVSTIAINPKQLQKEPNPIGTGKFGTIYKGKWKDTPVAIKEYKYTKDHLHEANIIQHINNTKTFGDKYENIVRPLGFCSELFITELMDAGSGDKLLHSNKSTNIRHSLYIVDILDILMDVCRAMSCIHLMGIIHRDLAARNILFRATQQRHKKFIIKLCDFGEAEINKHKTKSRKGPYIWMSPESIRKQICNIKTDIYSFGILCYELIVGSRPFPNTPVEVAIIEILCLSQRPNITQYLKAMPLPLFILVQICWQQIPEYRHNTFGDILDELDTLRTMFYQRNDTKSAQNKPKIVDTEYVNTRLSDIKFNKHKSKEILKDLSYLISVYLSDDHNAGNIEYKKKMKQELLKRIFNYKFEEETDIAAVNFYLEHYPWGEQKTEEHQAIAAQNVDEYSKQFDIKLKFINQ